MEYLRNHTDIKIPLIQSYGTREECPPNLGPFIIMEYAPNSGTMGKAIGMPTANGARFMLNPDVNEDKLYRAYSHMAEILLQLSKLEFSKTGSLVDRGDEQWDIAGRPITYDMNETVQLGSLPRSKLPHGTFDTSSSFLEACAKLHCDHFEHQRNDALSSEADGEEKYTQRLLFRKYLQSRSNSHSSHDSGQFKLWCDDLRPSNVLVDDNLSVVSVIDWEFTYAAPPEFSNAPPWWLLLVEPEKHESGVDAWAEEYDSRLKIFLAALKEQEAAMVARGTLRRDQILSNDMKKSWESGDFWVMLSCSCLHRMHD
ncbi:hypothetical protein FH972_024223 [Carpinus fangiana]|uniref:Aminoglycoside phosphotransferase domain-containing protein n=1 Tax=Carpinus fangiana TaxID=176857 RepID=A0A5N6KXR0_9ROSI|nr:hypothetical protein FH972_024223 [Carpinus fangiana]